MATSAGWPAGSLAAVYDPTEQGGIAKLGAPDVALGVRSVRLLRSAWDRTAPDTDCAGGRRWHWNRGALFLLLAKAGVVECAMPFRDGYTLLSVAGYAPAFVRHAALGAWPLPPELTIERRPHNRWAALIKNRRRRACGGVA